MITNHEMRMEIRKLAKYMLDLTIKIEKMEKALDDLSLTQKHLREVFPQIKQLDSKKETKCPTCEGKGFKEDIYCGFEANVECWRCSGKGVL